MKANALFVGWGEVAERFYADYLRTLPPCEWDFVRAERPEDPRVGRKGWVAWGDPGLERGIAAGQFQKIFLLTPPQVHIRQLLRCAHLLREAPGRCEVYVEKPLDLDPELAEAQVPGILGLLHGAGHEARVIDHYTQKWAVRWLAGPGRQALGAIAPLREILFLSLESREMPDSASFARGYAREHGVHAWAALGQVLPELAGTDTRIAVETGDSRAWRYQGCTGSCPAETCFHLRYRVALTLRGFSPYTPGTEIRLAAGKALGADAKCLLFSGDVGGVLALLSADRVFAAVQGEAPREIAEHTASRRSAYETVLDGVFRRRGLSPEQTTLPLEAGLWALRAIDRGARSLPPPSPLAYGQAPDLLTDLVRRVAAAFPVSGWPPS